VLLLLFLACSGGKESSAASNADNTDILTTSSECDSGGCGVEDLTVEPKGGGTVAVTVGNYQRECCLQTRGTATAADGDVGLAFQEEGTPCDCSCLHILQFELKGLSPGETTFHTPDASVTATVQ
jgi:hypothetical protein